MVGDIFHQAGLGASVTATIQDREAKVKGASQCAGGARSALDLLELAILPTLLYNSETWVEISKEAEEKLENLQLFFVRLILRVPQGTPKIALRSETGLLSMKLRIWKRKCMLVHHIKNMGMDTLARQVYDEQQRFGWPGLAKEASSICLELGIEDVNATQMGKNGFKKLIDGACKTKDEEMMKAGMKGKLERLKQEDCKIKEYMNLKSLKEVRDTFRMRTQLVEGFKGNFKNMYKHASLSCEGCGMEVDTQAHAMMCTAYADLRDGKDMSNDSDLVNFFRRVLERRDSKK